MVLVELHKQTKLDWRRSASALFVSISKLRYWSGKQVQANKCTLNNYNQCYLVLIDKINMRIHRMKTHAFITSVSVDEGIKANKKQIVYPQSSCPCSGRSHHFEFIRVFIYFLWASHFRGQLYIPFERWTICLGLQCIDFTLSLDLSMGWFQIVCNGSQWTI